MLRRPSIYWATPSCNHVGARLCVFWPMKLWVSSCFSTRASSGVTARQPLHRNADAAVVQRAHPARRAGDVRERLAGVENHADGIRRREIQLRFQIAKIVFEDAHDAARQVGRRIAVIFQIEMRGFAFAVAFFFGLIALGFFQGALYVRIRDAIFPRDAIRPPPNPFCSRRSRPSR